jgi:DnaJ family protein B protein 6
MHTYNYITLGSCYVFDSSEKKRRMYDKYGKEDLSQTSRGRSRYYGAAPTDDIHDFFSTTFRDPGEVFREFFGGCSPFGDLFAGMVLML